MAAMSRVVLSMLFFCGAAAANTEDEPAVGASLATDDECASSGGSASCALNALQRLSGSKWTGGCPAGFGRYSAGAGCRQCPPGTWSDWGDDNCTQCHALPPPEENTTPPVRAFTCLKCALGEWKTQGTGEKTWSVLNFETCRWVTEATAIAIAHAAEKLVDLEYVYLSGLDLGKEGATVIAPTLEKLVGLKGLGLRKNDLREAGVTILAPALEKLVRLTFLYFGENNMGKAGMTALAPALEKFVDLDYLELHGNSLGKAGARALAPALAKMPLLRNLTLYDNGLEQADVDMLKAAAINKNLGIEWQQAPKRNR